MNIIIVGMNYKTAPLEVRERLSAGCSDGSRSLAEIASIYGIREAMCLSTCNRFEILASALEIDAAAEGVKAFMLSRGNLAPGEIAEYVYVHRGRDAVRHLFRVASSIDSMIMGEPQILGQVKEAYRHCVDRKTSGESP